MSLLRDPKVVGERAERRPGGASLKAKRGERINRNKQCDRSKGTVRGLRLRREAESRHFDSPGHCKSMLPGFCFSCGFSTLHPPGLQRDGEAQIWQVEKITSEHFRKFSVFSSVEISNLSYRVTVPDNSDSRQSARYKFCCRSRTFGW